MSYEIRANPIFEADKKQFLKNRPLAKKDVERALQSFSEHPKQGDFYVGTAPELYKARWPLKSYNIGARGGLRVVYAVQEKKKLILPITLWQKKDFENERDAVAHVKQRYKDTVRALQSAST